MDEKKIWKNCNRFSEKLSRKMLQMGLNGQKLARKSDVSDSEISRIMNQKSLPGLENAIALAKAVEVSLDYLADDDLLVDPDQPRESSNEFESQILKLVREIGYFHSHTLLENTRKLGYELALNRLIEAKPVVTPVLDGARSLVTPNSNSGRVNSA